MPEANSDFNTKFYLPEDPFNALPKHKLPTTIVIHKRDISLTKSCHKSHLSQKETAANSVKRKSDNISNKISATMGRVASYSCSSRSKISPSVSIHPKKMEEVHVPMKEFVVKIPSDKNDSIFGHADMAGGGTGMIVPYGKEIGKKTNTSSNKSSQDPPDADDLRYYHRRSLRLRRCGLEPDPEASFVKSVANDKPSVEMAERRSSLASRRTSTASIGCKEKKKYSNCKSNKHDETQRVDHGISELTFRGQDPPEGKRGCDPTENHAMVPYDPPPTNEKSSMLIHRSLADRRKSRGPRRTTSSSFKSKDAAHSIKLSRSKEIVLVGPTSSTTKNNGKQKEKKQREIRGILKKKNVQPPIAYFGGTLNEQSSSGEKDNKDGASGSDNESFGKKTDKTPSRQMKEESKHSKRNHKTEDHNGGDDDSVDAKSVPSTNTKSGLRSGKFAAANAAAVANQRSYSFDEYFDDDDCNSQTRGDSKKNNPEFDYSSDNSTDNEDEGYKFDRTHSHFLRTADLGLTQDTIFAQQFLDNPNAIPEPHYHHPTPHPPPGVQFHIDENWICVDDGKGGISPIAPQAVDALVSMGYRTASDPMMWTPTTKTRKFMTEKNLRFDDIPIPGPLAEGEGGPNDNCLVWSGKFNHKYYGSELPAIRSQGIVNMSPEDLVDLLMDSNRVNEYNKSSIGRNDEVVLSDGKNLDTCPFSGSRKKKLTGVVMDGSRVVDGVAVMEAETDDEQSDFECEEHVFDESGTKSVRTFTTRDASGTSRRERKTSQFLGVTKLVRSTNKLPLIRRKLQFVTLLHCRALSDEQGGDGYIIVGRAITPAEDEEKDCKRVMQSEVLLNVYIIRRLGGNNKGLGSSGKSVVSSSSGRKAKKADLANRCLMTAVTHLKSPLIPNLIAKQVGLSAAANFLSDIRSSSK